MDLLLATVFYFLTEALLGWWWFRQAWWTLANWTSQLTTTGGLDARWTLRRGLMRPLDTATQSWWMPSSPGSWPVGWLARVWGLSLFALAGAIQTLPGTLASMSGRKFSLRQLLSCSWGLQARVQQISSRLWWRRRIGWYLEVSTGTIRCLRQRLPSLVALLRCRQGSGRRVNNWQKLSELNPSQQPLPGLCIFNIYW